MQGSGMKNETEFESTLEVPKPGIYHDVLFETYLGWKAVSNSRMGRARRSLLHYKEQIIKETQSLSLGRLIHCGVLEPLAVAMRYAVMPPYENDAGNCTGQGKQSTSKATKYYEAKATAFRTANADKEIVEQSDYDVLIGINRSLMRSERAREYLSERGQAEVSLVWVDPETELLCKARVDFLNSAINDLKSCVDAVEFSKSIASYGYHRQGAFYQYGYAVLTGEIKPFRLIAVEKTSPFGVRAAPLSDEALQVGESEVRELLRAIADAYDSNEWPCYSDPETWCLPSYYESNSDPIELTIGGETVTL